MQEALQIPCEWLRAHLSCWTFKPRYYNLYFADIVTGEADKYPLTDLPSGLSSSNKPLILPFRRGRDLLRNR